MPVLTNPRHEAFCQQIIEGARYGRTQAQAYSRAGFRADGHSAAMAASRLMKKDDIRGRIAELTAPVVRKTRATVDTLAEQFDVVFDGAVGDAHWGAAGSAAGLKAKLLGFMREKIEIGGPGMFDPCETREQVADRMLDECGSLEAALAGFDELRASLIDAAARRARPVG